VRRFLHCGGRRLRLCAPSPHFNIQTIASTTMKKLIALLAALCVAASVSAAPKKEDKEKEKKKEAPKVTWTIVVEGGTGDTAAAEVKTYLASMKGVHVEECAIKDGKVEAIVTSAQPLMKSAVSKALKENKALKVTDFKKNRPEREKRESEEATEKKDEPKKEEPAKPGDKKPEAAAESTKPAAAEGDKKPE
jgi:hypothetical protein